MYWHFLDASRSSGSVWRIADSNTDAYTNADSNAHADARAERGCLGGGFDTGGSRISRRWQRLELDCC